MDSIPFGAVVITRKQTRGRGRMRREWFGPEGGLWFSVLLKPQVSISKLPLYSIIAGLSTSHALKDILGDVWLKWPNDVMVGNRKISGILLELARGKHQGNSLGDDALGGSPRNLIMGIGVNVNFSLSSLPPFLQDAATTLQHETGRKYSENAILIDILNELFNNCELIEKNDGIASLLNRYRELCRTIGSKVTIEMPGGEIKKGLAMDISDNGSLIMLSDDTGEKELILSGDVIL